MTADPNRDQFGDRDAQSISDDNQSLQDLNYIIDQLEREEMETLSLEIVSSQDEELKVDWEVSRTPSPDNTIAPDVSSRPYLLEADLNLSVDSVTSPPPPSLDSFFPCSLIEDSAFSIEKVLGPTTANILAEAEAEASKYADGLQSLEIEWSEDTNEPHRLLTCQICQLFVRTVDRLLDKSEQLMDHYLPLTEEEIANLKKAVEELDDSTTDHEMQVCFARISNLSGKLRQRAYMMALSKLRLARKNTEDNLAQLQQTIDLIGQVQRVDAMDYQKSFEKLTEISIQWSQRNSLQQQSVNLQTESFSSGQSIEEIGPRLAQSSEIEETGVSISISSKVEETEEAPVQGETPEMVPTFSAEIEILPTEEVTPPPDVSAEKLPSPPEEVEPEAPSPPEEVEPEAPPEEVEPEAPPEVIEPEAPPEVVEPEAPPEEVEPEAPAEEVEPEAPPEEVEPEAPPEEVEPEAPPEEVEPEAPPEEVEPEAPPEEVEPEAPPEEVEPEAPPEEVEPEAPPEEVEPEVPPSPPEEVEPEVPPSPPEEVEPEAPSPPEEVEPEVPPSPPEEVEPEVPPSPPEEVEPEVPPSPPEEVEPEVPPSPPEEVEPEAPPEEVAPELPPSPPEEIEPEVPPSPPEEVEPEKPPSPPEEVEPEKPPTPPAEVEPEKPPTPPPEVPKPPKKVALTPVAKEKVHRDVAHITLTSPGCDEDDLLLRMARSEEDITSEVEIKTLEMSRSLTSNLKNTYESLLANLKDLPSNLQNKLYQTCRDMSELHSSFTSAHCFSDLSSGLLNKSFAVMAEAQGSMDELMEYALQSPKALLWLKDYFPPILSRKQETHDSTAEREAEEEMPPYDMRDTESNILKIQRAYDPGECYNGALFAKEEAEEAPRSRELEDILKIQEAYEPQGCKEDTTPSEDETEVSPPSKEESKNWGIMKMLETYVPKISTIQALLEKKKFPSSLQKDEEEASAQEVEEALPSRDDILKLLRAYEPKGCEELSDPTEVPTLGQKEVPLPSRADILKLLQAYDPQECHDDRLPSKEEKEDMEALRMSTKEAPSIKKVEFPPPVRKEDVIPPPVQKEEVVPPPVQVEVVAPLVQKEEEVPTSVQEDVPPLIQEEELPLPVPYATQSDLISSRNNILKLEVNESNNNNEVPSLANESNNNNEVPSLANESNNNNEVLALANESNNNNEVPALAAEKEKQPPPEQPKNLLEIQKAYEPRECEDGSSIRRQAGEGSSSAPREQVDILKIQRAYDPKECEEMTPYREAEEASTAGSAASGRSEWSLFKLVQSYIPKSLKEEIFSKKEEDK